uniref:Putative acyltransferase n=1 Tax=Ixodes ricinus TaxID=34613 RepID=V5GKE9_IXORI
MLAATRLAFLAAFGVVLGGRTAWAVDLKGLGFDPSKSLNMAAAMLPVVCNANEQQKTDMECAGCIYSISEFLRALARAEEWAITMTDALVKPPAGILGGTFSFLSSFDDCLGVPPANTTDAFLKRAFNISTLAPSYCSFKISVGLPDNDTELHHEPPQGGLMAMLEKQKGELKDVAELLEEFPGFLGLCLPSACTVKSLKAVGKGALFLLRTLGVKPPNVKLGIEVVDCVTKDSLNSHEQSATVLATLIVVGVLMVLVLLGTPGRHRLPPAKSDRELSSRDLPKLQSFDIMSQNSYVETLRCFSAYRNFRLLMSGRHPEQDAPTPGGHLEHELPLGRHRQHPGAQAVQPSPSNLLSSLERVSERPHDPVRSQQLLGCGRHCYCPRHHNHLQHRSAGETLRWL